MVGVWINRNTGEVYSKYYYSGFVRWEINEVNQYDHQLIEILFYSYEKHCFMTYNCWLNYYENDRAKHKKRIEKRLAIRRQLVGLIDKILKTR